MTESENLIDTVRTDLEPEGVVARLETMSKRGKLAGFERGGSGGSDSSFAAHGTPFEGRVRVTTREGAARFELHMPPRGAWIFAVILALSVWPGVLIMDSFLYSFVWYERLMGLAPWLETWVWYVPLTAIPAPFMVRSAVRKSRASAMEHASETVARVRAVLEDAGSP